MRPADFIAMCARIDPDSKSDDECRASLECIVIIAEKMQQQGLRPAGELVPSFDDGCVA